MDGWLGSEDEVGILVLIPWRSWQLAASSLARTPEWAGCLEHED